MPLPASCFDDPAQQGQVTLADGYYKFDLNFSDPACPSGGDYLIEVTAPGSGYMPGYSQIIPPIVGCRDRSVLGAVLPGQRRRRHCRHGAALRVAGVRVRAGAVGAGAQRGHQLPRAPDAQRQPVPGSSQIFNNHMPLDPTLDGAVAISKTTPMLNVTRGQLVPYTITVHNQFRCRCRRDDRRSLPGGLQVRRGLGAHRRRAGRADGRGPRAHLERAHARGVRASTS